MNAESNIATQQNERCYHNAQSPAQLPVHIRQDGEVDNEVVNLRRCVGDEIVWFSESDDFTVNFPNSPFAEDTFHVPAGGTANSGPVRPDASIDYFQYFITNVALAKSADPGANVKP